MKFRPCIDLRKGKVTQIVGSTLKDTEGKWHRFWDGNLSVPPKCIFLLIRTMKTPHNPLAFEILK